MSHFNALVIIDAESIPANSDDIVESFINRKIEEILKPYDENMKVPHTLYQERAELIYLEREFYFSEITNPQGDFQTYLRDPEKFEKQLNDQWRLDHAKAKLYYVKTKLKEQMLLSDDEIFDRVANSYGYPVHPKPANSDNFEKLPTNFLMKMVTCGVHATSTLNGIIILLAVDGVVHLH